MNKEIDPIEAQKIKLGENLRAYRINKLMNQTEVADLAKVSLLTVSRAERGFVSLDSLLRICAALEVKPSMILGRQIKQKRNKHHVGKWRCKLING